MGYLIKSEVMNELQEDMETTLMCYDDKGTMDIISFCYECMSVAIDRLPQYRLENVTEIDTADTLNFIQNDMLNCKNAMELGETYEKYNNILKQSLLNGLKKIVNEQEENNKRADGSSHV